MHEDQSKELFCVNRPDDTRKYFFLALYINLINDVANNANNLSYIVCINSFKNILWTEHLALKAKSKHYKYVAE